MVKQDQRGHIANLRSQSWKCWNLELSLDLSDPKVLPFPIRLLWESSQTAIIEAMGIHGNVLEEYVDREETMAKDRTWASKLD